MERSQSFDPHEKININKIYIGQVLHHAQCASCLKKISKGDLAFKHLGSNSREKKSHHLECFKPFFKTTIDKNRDIDYGILNKENYKRFMIWLKKWNSENFLYNHPEHSLSDFHFQQNVRFNSPVLMTESLKRLNQIVHCLKYLPLSDILYNVALTCKNFYNQTHNQHLWRELVFRDYDVKTIELFTMKDPGDPVIASRIRFIETDTGNWTTNWRSIYIYLARTTCLECKRFKLDSRICPIYRKPLCKKCRITHVKYELLPLTQVKKEYGSRIARRLEESDARFAESDKGVRLYYRESAERAKQECQLLQSPNSIAILFIFVVDKRQKIRLKTLSFMYRDTQQQTIS
eukprot:TRINITY_DN3991_c0_g2_i1.p1 TRINITY_DN3991_c0_g2~~TRINITY_DN3991_c0_g2_i1.p1  ORF type:complete len:347 (+),score=34.90 TRINITY_DN3991_c0_g2_i1:67-1107(+)